MVSKLVSMLLATSMAFNVGGYKQQAVTNENIHHKMNYEYVLVEDLGHHHHAIIEVTCTECDYVDMIESWWK